LPSKNDPANEPEQQPPDLFSSVETRAMLEEFRELVRAGILRVTPENEVLPVKERPEKGGEKPPAPSSREEEVALLDKQLIEWLERRREKKQEEARRRGEPARPAAAEAMAAGIRDKVIERVAQKVIEAWDQSSLRDQIIDRIAEDIYRRMQRNLE
jgi:hypothetical protein